MLSNAKKNVVVVVLFYFFAGRGFCAVDTTSYVLSPRLIQVRDLALSEDETNTLTIRDINKMHFEAEKDKSIGISKSTFWVQFSIKNNSASDSLYVLLENPTLNTLFFIPPLTVRSQIPCIREGKLPLANGWSV